MGGPGLNETIDVSRNIYIYTYIYIFVFIYLNLFIYIQYTYIFLTSQNLEQDMLAVTLLTKALLSKLPDPRTGSHGQRRKPNGTLCCRKSSTATAWPENSQGPIGEGRWYLAVVLWRVVAEVCPGLERGLIMVLHSYGLCKPYCLGSRALRNQQPLNP